jgi:hypothetical protein
MKTQSNIQFPKEPVRWKEGQWAYFYNHVDNGVQTEENAGNRYEADLTILNDLSLNAALTAITRKTNDPDLDQKVIDNIEVNGKEAILSTPVYETKVSTSVFPTLPSSGNLKKDEIYSYGNGAVMVVQKHTRTAYAPELTPALFSFYRTVTEGQPWITGEQVGLNSTRTYNGKTYKCIQPHQSQEAWNPELTVGTLWQVVVTSAEWTIGVAYKVGDIVTYLGKTYKCLQAHTSISTWTPTAAASLWKLQ